MTDQRPDDLSFPTGEVDTTGQPLDTEQVMPPQQVPMDDAAGGPQADDDTFEDDGGADSDIAGKDQDDLDAEDLEGDTRQPGVE